MPQDPLPHISVASLLGDLAGAWEAGEGEEKEGETQEDDDADDDLDLHTVLEISVIYCKIGNKVMTFPLLPVA